MNRQKLITNLVVTRTAIGLASWLAPRLAGRAFGLDVAGNPQAPYLARLFGVRDVALGYGLLTSGAAQRGTWLQIGVACDLADVGAGLLGRRDGDLPLPTTVLVTATAAVAAGLGIAALTASE